MWWTCWDHKISRSWIWAPQPLFSFSGSLIWSVTTFCDPLLTPQKQGGKQTSGGMTGDKCLGSISNCFSKLHGSTSWLREATYFILEEWGWLWALPYHCSQCRSDFTSFHLRFQAFGWLIGWFEKHKIKWSEAKRKCVCINNIRTSLVVQWIGICLPTQGTGVQSLVQEDPTCLGATKPMRHNYWSLCAWNLCSTTREARVLQLEKGPSDEDPGQPKISK